MDDETRFWIAKEVADSKYTPDITPMFQEGRKVAGKAPTTLITDGAFNFSAGYERAFSRENRALMIEHVRHVRISGDNNNNRMERLNGESHAVIEEIGQSNSDGLSIITFDRTWP